MTDIEGLTPLDRRVLVLNGINSLEAFWQRKVRDPQVIDSLGLPDDAAKSRITEAILQAMDAKLVGIEGLTAADRRALLVNGVSSIEDFSSRMAANAKLIENLGLPDAAAKKRMTEAMAQSVLERAKSFSSNPFRDHLADLVVVVALCLVAYGVIARLIATRAQVVVVRSDGLAPFQLISSSDVQIRTTLKAPAATSSPDMVVGRYPTHHIAQGAVIDISKLSKHVLAGDQLAGRDIFSVKLQPSTVLDELPLPVKISLMVTPREKDAKSTPIEDVYLLDMHPQADGISAVIATAHPDSQVLLQQLARSDLVVIGPGHY